MRQPKLVKSIVMVALMTACSSALRAPAAVKQPASDPTPADTRAVLLDAALLLDVRNQDEYERGHLEGALLIPVAELAGRLGEVEAALGGDKSKKIVAYCGSGKRAGQAKELLEQQGFSNVVNGGGYEALK